MAYPFPFVANQVLTAAELNALEPQVSAGLGLVTGQYYTSAFETSTTSVASAVARGTFVPFFVNAASTFDRIGIQSGSIVTNPTSVRIGIYTNTSGKPDALVLDAGTVSITAINTAYEITISQALEQGWYWLAAANETVASTTNITQITGDEGVGSSRLGSANSRVKQLGWLRNTFPSPFPATAGTVSTSIVSFLVTLRTA